MAGGVGTRFWPYSRNAHPKQFIDVLGTGKSLLQMTYERFLNLADKEHILILTNQKYADLVKKQLPDLADDQILTEPDRRNTAPCIAYAAYKIQAKNPNAVMIVTPSDHAIFNEKEFIKILENASTAAAQRGSDRLITIGITPNRPETGYGYIQFLENGEDLKKVKTFTEKPPLEMARTFLESGDFLWNAGIFTWSVEAIVNAYRKHLPDIADIFEKGRAVYFTSEERSFIDQNYSFCQNVSIDYGILEKSENVFVVPGDFDWSDLGSWSSLHDIRPKDDRNNVIDANVILGECTNSFIKSDSKRLIVADNLDGYLIADFEDVLLVCKKDQEAKFREYVAEVKSKKGEQYL